MTPHNHPYEPLPAAVVSLTRFLDEDRSVVAFAAGLQAVVMWSMFHPPASRGDDEIASLSSLIERCPPVLATVLGDRVPADHIYFGLGCANAALYAQDPLRRNELIAFAAYLQSECRTIVLADYVSRSADPAMRAMLLHREQQQRHPMQSRDVH